MKGNRNDVIPVRVDAVFFAAGDGPEAISFQNPNYLRSLERRELAAHRVTSICSTFASPGMAFPRILAASRYPSTPSQAIALPSFIVRPSLLNSTAVPS